MPKAQASLGLKTAEPVKLRPPSAEGMVICVTPEPVTCTPWPTLFGSAPKIQVLLAELVLTTTPKPNPKMLLSGRLNGCQLCPFHCWMIAPCDAQELSVQPAPVTQALFAPDAATLLSCV